LVLGLATVRRLAEAHGGEAGIADTRVGSLFWNTLLLVAIRPNASPTSSRPGTPAGSLAIEMGGMFTIVKVRQGIATCEDPGWYMHPEGTLARKISIYRRTGLCSGDARLPVIRPRLNRVATLLSPARSTNISLRRRTTVLRSERVIAAMDRQAPVEDRLTESSLEDRRHPQHLPHPERKLQHTRQRSSALAPDPRQSHSNRSFPR
jgi:hypothetical protein